MHFKHLTNPLLGVTTIALVAPGPVAMAEQPAEAVQTFDYHHGSVLGTAMNLTVVAPTRADADAADSTVLAEIQRLQNILSAYDANSELGQLNASPVNGPGIKVSPELIEVLKQYDVWFKRTGGAYSGHSGAILSLWEQAEKNGSLPTDADLQTAATLNSTPAWQIDEATKTVKRIADQKINVDSLGKGYIIDKAVAAATRAPTHLNGLLLNIGGDLRTWGTPDGKAGSLWSIGIQDPAHPELNAPPLTTLFIPGSQSVSTSGAYQRFYTIDGKQYSHIIDARTGKTGRNEAATVLAPDSATANALATICCAMKFAEGFELVGTVPNAECLIITSTGRQLRSDGFKEFQDRSLATARTAPRMASQFPEGFKLSVNLETTQTEHWPYVFAWVTDAAGKYVKTLAAFGDDPRWESEIREWWKFASNNRALQRVTRATQRPGKYPLSWDGTDQQGAGVPLGKYTVWVEVGSEHGPHAARSTPIELGKDAVTATIGKSAAFADTAISYGPKASN